MTDTPPLAHSDNSSLSPDSDAAIVSQLIEQISIRSHGNPEGHLGNTGENHSHILQSIAHPAPRFPPHDYLPCANVNAATDEVCMNRGSMACAGCKLVSYCSKACQKEHWRTHKQDCKHPMNSSEWVPAFAQEGREPNFDSFTAGGMRRVRHSQGWDIWGNMPAMDIINLSENENDPKMNLNVAFLGCRDFRNVLKTVTSLPENYVGKLTILMNDTPAYQRIRHLLMLLILGSIDDVSLAADMALHLSYSAFLPMEYYVKIYALLTRLLTEESPIVLGTSSSGSQNQLYFDSELDQDTRAYMLSNLAPIRGERSIEDAQRGYNAMRSDPARADLAGLMYFALKPSHRIAAKEYRGFGLVLPFGAVNTHFNTPNPTLFAPSGMWLQHDASGPLGCYNISEVIVAGKAHGANPEDIYGCLYFHLTAQLREFKRRLNKFSISITISGHPTTDLTTHIQSGTLAQMNIPPSIRFDRISLANLIDDNYVGLKDALTAWGPLLSSSSEHSAIVGYLMNWIVAQQDANIVNAPLTKMREAMNKLVELCKTRFGSFGPLNNGPATLHPHKTRALEVELTLSLQPFYDTTPAFQSYLKKKELQRILSKANLSLRTKHKVLPHRIGTAIGDPPTALPRFTDENDCYTQTKRVSQTWWERYVEFVRT